jgi:hypothetical protein
MVFEGKIIRVLPTRGGVSERTGNQWKALPFVFSYYEPGQERVDDRVLLETFDTNVMAQIAQYCVKGQDSKAVVENGSLKLTGQIPCKIGFGHKVKDVKNKQGDTVTLNEMRIYSIEIGTASQQQPAAQQPQAPFPPQTRMGTPSLLKNAPS